MTCLVFVSRADDRMDWMRALAGARITLRAALNLEQAVEVLGELRDAALVLFDCDSDAPDLVTALEALITLPGVARPELHLLVSHWTEEERRDAVKTGVDGVWDKGHGADALVDRMYAAVRRAERYRELWREQQRLAVGALTDSTGLFNLAYMQLRVSEELARAHRTDTPVSVLMIELLSANELRETHPQEIAELHARHLLARLCRSVRSYDVVCRLNEGRAALLLPGVDPKQSYSLAQRLLANMQARPVFVTTDDGVVRREAGLALGIAGFDEGKAQPEPMVLLRAAGQAVSDAMHENGRVIGFVTIDSEVLSAERERTMESVTETAHDTGEQDLHDLRHHLEMVGLGELVFGPGDDAEEEALVERATKRHELPLKGRASMVIPAPEK